MKNYSFLLLITLSFISCGKNEKTTKNSELPFFNTALFTPEWISEKSSNYKNIHTIPQFSFINQDGNLVTNETYKEKMYVADFFFVSCPGICPKLTKNMSILQEEFNDDSNVLLLSHTVMPQSDSVPVLKEYALHNDINSKKWSLVTGDKDEIYAIARTGYFADEDFVKTKDENTFIHTENFVLVDKKGRIRGVYNGTLSVEVKRLIKHIGILKLED
jgi:protein SCO1/2